MAGERRTSGCRCLELLPDGSYRSVLIKTSDHGAARRDELTEAARRGEDLDPALARHVRVVEYEVTDRDGEDALIALVTTITDWQAAPARRPGLGLPRKMAARDRERAGQDRPARPRQDPALRQPGAGPAGDLGLPPDRLGRQRPDQRRRRGRLDRPRAGSASPRPSASSAGPSARPFPPQQADEAPGPRHGRDHQEKEPQPRPPHRSCPRAVKRWRPSHTPSRNQATRHVRHNGPAHHQARQPRKPPAQQHEQHKLNGIGRRIAPLLTHDHERRAGGAGRRPGWAAPRRGGGRGEGGAGGGEGSPAGPA